MWIRKQIPQTNAALVLGARLLYFFFLLHASYSSASCSCFSGSPSLFHFICAHTFIIVKLEEGKKIELSSLSRFEDGTEKECLNESTIGSEWNQHVRGRESCLREWDGGIWDKSRRWDGARGGAGARLYLRSFLYHNLILRAAFAQ